MNLLDRRSRESPTAIALRYGDREYTYETLAALVTDLSENLSRRGIRAGQRVAIVGSSDPMETALLVHAIWVLDGSVSPINTRLSRDEQREMLEFLRPAWIVDGSALEGGDLRSGTGARPALKDEAALLFTSGSTKAPKAVPLPWSCFRAHALASAERLGRESDDHWLSPLPLFHIGGLTVLYRALEQGSGVTLMNGFNVDSFCALARESAATITSLVPTMLYRLFQQGEDFRGDCYPRLRAILLGGAPAPASMHQEARRRGLPVLSTYGMTETTSQIATVGPRSLVREIHTAAPPLAGFSIRIRDADGSLALPLHEGGIEVAGPAVFPGYLTDQGLDRSCFIDEWFCTGDLGHLDEVGQLTVTGRADDLIITGGENVHPSEVEAVLLMHPQVRDAAVVGLPDLEWGQRISAVIVFHDRGNLESVETWCRERLAGYKIPRRWQVALEVPRTASGKIRRRELPGIFHEKD